MDLKARARARATDVEDWVMDQHRRGAAATNPNFIPISGVWKERAAARAAAHTKATELEDAAAAAAKDQPEVLFFDKQPDLRVLSVGLPENWSAMWDGNTRGVYYGNCVSKVC